MPFVLGQAIAEPGVHISTVEQSTTAIVISSVTGIIVALIGAYAAIKGRRRSVEATRQAATIDATEHLLEQYREEADRRSAEAERLRDGLIKAEERFNKAEAECDERVKGLRHEVHELRRRVQLLVEKQWSALEAPNEGNAS